MIKFCKSREICTATKCFTSQQFNWHLAFEQFFYSTLTIDWLFSNQMADSLWKSRPEFIPSIVVYSIAFVVSPAIFIVKNQTTNLTSALVLGKLGPSKLDPSQIGQQIWPNFFWGPICHFWQIGHPQMGPLENVGAANWAPCRSGTPGFLRKTPMQCM